MWWNIDTNNNLLSQTLNTILLIISNWDVECVQMKPGKWSEGITPQLYSSFLYSMITFIMCKSWTFSGSQRVWKWMYLSPISELNRGVRSCDPWAPRNGPDILKHSQKMLNAKVFLFQSDPKDTEISCSYYFWENEWVPYLLSM